MSAAPPIPVWKTFGFWCAMIMALAQASSAARAFADPQAFSQYMGIPVNSDGGAGFVLVYALRTTLISFLAFYMAFTRRFDALGIIAIAALLLPLGDAWLSWQAGADTSILYRHLGIAAFLAFTAVILLRDAKRVTVQ